MSRNAVIVKREKSLAEQIITVVMISVLMAGFWYYFLKQEQQFTLVGFETIAGKFATNVSTIRAQWFMDKQPAVIMLKEQIQQGVDQKTQRNISVNKKGWVDSKKGNLDCISIWQQVMNSPLVFMNKPVAALQINNNSGVNKRLCRYMLASGEYFQYNPDNGKVSNILIIK
ncbi:hypothetical protein [Thalassotalea profundi]|uniref:Type II secretion system protein n=1 Tax=Thalassotalea profundi TaxID=2036687 RepID=A0ABQ3J4M6_9GAMM|nr:hypothetical protein [Thalassotalea profundi]GHE99142.1 hypothetical protein GCM10011501_30860 [Thalassotalea profundi]